ncbi:MAG: hypothetical protein HY376_00870 [Candidatus Blackburnbacteria bacterium]|nr:hypothetical protein [Candidatus Blackburnbacteria bacterium]
MDIFRLDPAGVIFLEQSRKALSDQLTLLPRQEDFVIETGGRCFVGDRWVKGLLALINREEAFLPPDFFKVNPDGGFIRWSPGEFTFETHRNSFKVELCLGGTILLQADSLNGVRVDQAGMQDLVSRLYRQNRSVYRAYKAWAFVLREAIPAADIVHLFEAAR